MNTVDPGEFEFVAEISAKPLIATPRAGDTAPVAIGAKLLMHLSEGVMLTDAHLRITFVNAALRALYAHHSSLIGEYCFRVLLHAQSPCPKCPIFQTGGERRTATEVHLRGEDGGHLHWLAYECVPHGDAESGRLLGAFGLFREISGRKQVEQQLENAYAYLTTIINIIPLPIAIISTRTQSLRTNRAFLHLYGDMAVQTVSDFQWLNPETLAPFAPDLRPEQRAMRGETLDAFEALLVMPDQRTIPMLGHVAPIYHAGECVAVVMALQDIAQLKEADRAKDQFFAMLSHELMSPLTNIIGWTEAAMVTDEKAIIEKALAIISRNALRQYRVIDEMLDVSRIIHGKLSLRPEAADLYQLASHAVESAAPLARERGIDLRQQASVSALPILADPIRIAQIISNLIQNALKFTDTGGKVTVNVFARNGRAVLEVSDTGRGIQADDMPLIFRPFHQASQRHLTNGLGLGLALVKGIAELHQGIVSAYSDGPGQGSTFTVELPLLHLDSTSA